MKKAVFVICLICIAAPSFADSTLSCVEKSQFFSNKTGKIVTCTATADGATYTTLPILLNIGGLYLYSLSVVNGATGPTDNSDLELLEDSTSGIDILGGSGANIIDNAATNTIRPTISGVAASAPIFGTLYVKASGNIVSSAIFVLTLRLVPQIP